MKKATHPRPAPELIWRELDDGLVVVSPAVGKVRVFNEVGTTIWRLLVDDQSVDAIESYLVEHYRISHEEAEADLQSFLTELTDRGLIVWDE